MSVSCGGGGGGSPGSGKVMVVSPPPPPLLSVVVVVSSPLPPVVVSVPLPPVVLSVPLPLLVVPSPGSAPLSMTVGLRASHAVCSASSVALVIVPDQWMLRLTVLSVGDHQSLRDVPCTQPAVLSCVVSL